MSQVDFSNHPLRTNSQLAIGKKGLNPIANSQLVDELLEMNAKLIDPSYTKWFASKFMYMSADDVARCASEAKTDGKDPKRLFAFLVRKRSVQA